MDLSIFQSRVFTLEKTCNEAVPAEFHTPLCWNDPTIFACTGDMLVGKTKQNCVKLTTFVLFQSLSLAKQNNRYL